MAELDHIVLGAATLEAGAAFVQRHFGVAPEPGGAHDGVGTHNLLLGLGPSHYLEIMAPDPAQPTPAHPRPFGLDDPALRIALEAEPRLIAWVARTPALAAVVARLGPHGGEIVAMRRRGVGGDLAWRLAMPPPREAMDNLIPTLIQWDTGSAAARLPDRGWRLARLTAEHPLADAVTAAIASRGLAETLSIRKSNAPRLIAHLRHSDGTETTLTSG